MNLNIENLIYSDDSFIFVYKVPVKILPSPPMFIPSSIFRGLNNLIHSGVSQPYAGSTVTSFLND